MSSKHNEYPGLRSVGNRRTKYEGCVYRKLCGGTARELSDVEIEELRAHIERLKNPTIHVKPKFRRSIV